MPINPAFTPDSVGQNGLVIPRGSYAFLKVHLRKGPTGPLVTPDTGWEAHPSVVALQDPDAADILSAWATNELDPDDANDVYDENHSTYTGVTGLFHDGGGNISLKVKVPITAELTSDNSNRSYNVAWEILRNGVYITDNEDFNVAPAGVLVFQLSTITVDQVKVGISTSLSDAELNDIILEATEWVEAMLAACGVDPKVIDAAGLPLVLQATKLYSRSLIFDYDASAGTIVKSVKEGSKSVSFGGGAGDVRSGSSGDGFRLRATMLIDEYCKRFGDNKRAKLRVTNHLDGSGRALR